ncbi:transposase [Acetobacter malorum]|uniref:Transposase n=1 Tax=Acetobacter malorum TaxID=178901 RepID=A0A177G568_9PROT|nr:transposase [Acetobacter malorum]
MNLLSVVYRWHHRDALPISEIERRTGLSRNTIRKYLRADTIEPIFSASERPSKLVPRKQRRTGKLALT